PLSPRVADQAYPPSSPLRSEPGCLQSRHDTEGMPALPRFADQVAIVTGGAMGIGGATARRLAQDGARVLVADVDDQVAERNVQTIRAAGGTASSMHADVGTLDGIHDMVVGAVGLWGRLDIGVSNAY